LLPIDLYWEFYYLRRYSFIFLNMVGLCLLVANLKKTENRFTFKIEHFWIMRVFFVYSLMLFAVFYTMLSSSFQITFFGFEPDPYILIYISTLMFAALLTWFLFFRIDLLKYRYFSSNERFKKVGRSIIEDRKRTKNEIHDEIGPMFTQINIVLNTIQKQIKDSKNIIAIENMQYAFQDINNKIYEIVDNENDTIDFSIKTTLLKYADELQNVLGSKTFIDRYIKINEQYYNNKDLVEDIISIIKEFINNAVKYANADIIEIKLYEDSDYLIINVNDDGKGFNYKAAIKKKKQKARIDTGLKAIDRRVKYKGGKIKIISSLGKGCKIEIKYPLIILKMEDTWWNVLKLRLKDIARKVIELYLN